MNCRTHDSELLMLAHGELAGMQNILLRLHLARCSSCRERYASFVSASLAFSDALRGGGTPARGPVWPAALATAESIAHKPLRWPRLALPFGTAAVVIVGGAALVGGGALRATSAVPAHHCAMARTAYAIRVPAGIPTPSAAAASAPRCTERRIAAPTRCHGGCARCSVCANGTLKAADATGIHCPCGCQGGQRMPMAAPASSSAPAAITPAVAASPSNPPESCH